MLPLLLALQAHAESIAQVTTPEDPVYVEILDVRDVSISRSGIDFVMVVGMTRTRGLPIVLTDMQYEVLVGKQMVANAWQAEDKVKLRRGQTVEVSVPCTMSMDAGLGALKGLLQEGLPPVKLVGTVEGRVLLFSHEYSFMTDIFVPER